MPFDLSVLAGVGRGLDTVGEGLSRRALQKLAEEERERDRIRQAEQDALAKAQAGQSEFINLDKQNYSPVAGLEDPESMKMALTNAALHGKGTDVYQSDITGRRFERAPGLSPSAIKDQNTDQALALRQLAESLKEGRYDRPSGNTVTQQAGATQRTGMQQAGATTREGMEQAGANSRTHETVQGAITRDTNAPVAKLADPVARAKMIADMAQNLAGPQKRGYGVEEPGLPMPDAIRVATQEVDKLLGGAQAPVAKPLSQAEKANNAHAAIEAKTDLTPAEKMARHRLVDEQLKKNLQAGRP